MDLKSLLWDSERWDWYDSFILVCRELSAKVGHQSAFYGKPKPDEERFAVLDKCYEEGELFWDSADIYQDSEDFLGTSLTSPSYKSTSKFKFVNRIN